MTDELLRRLADLNPVEDPDRFIDLGGPDWPADPELRAVLEQARAADRRTNRVPFGPDPDPEETTMRTDHAVRTDLEQPTGRRSGHRWALTAAAGVVAVIAGAGVLAVVSVQPGGFLASDPDPAEVRAAEAVEVAEAYLAAHDSHDAAAAGALLADDVRLDTASLFLVDVDELEPTFEAARLWGFRVSPFECAPRSPDAEADRPVGVACTYLLDSTLQQILDHPPIEARWLLNVHDGRITWMSDGFPVSEYDSRVFTPFGRFLDEHHPGAFDELYRVEGGVARPRLDPEALELIPVYLDAYRDRIDELAD